jgi:Ca2+-binding EF-hand superfamily protein
MASASRERAAAVFEVMDKDKDGKLSFPEFRSRPGEAWFLRTDADEDGFCSFDEYMAVNGGPARKEFCLACFTPIDRDGDGRLNPEEFTNKSQEANFRKRDRDCDGLLTVEEYAAWARTPDQLAEAKAEFHERDANGDGRLDLRENLYGAADNDFWAADQNGDLVVDLDEFGKRMLVEGEAAAVAKLSEIFGAIDLNSSGNISLAEFKWQSPETRFQWFDLNLDAQLTVDEFVGNLEDADAIAQAEGTFANRDQDNNGSLSLAEYTGSGN